MTTSVEEMKAELRDVERGLARSLILTLGSLEEVDDASICDIQLNLANIARVAVRAAELDIDGVVTEVLGYIQKGAVEEGVIPLCNASPLATGIPTHRDTDPEAIRWRPLTTSREVERHLIGKLLAAVEARCDSDDLPAA